MSTAETPTKIFLADDNVISLNLFAHHIRSLGYADVSTFTNGSDCLDNLHQRPDVIFLDHNMDDLTGFEVLKKIKRHSPNAYVIMLSAQECMKTTVDSLKYGAFDYIIKGQQELDRITETLSRVQEIRKMVADSNPSFWRKVFSLI